MPRIPRLASVMTPFPYSVSTAAPLAEARALMASHGVHHLPVMDDERIAGVLTSRGAAAGEPDTRVGEVCEPDPYVVDLHVMLSEVLVQMAERRVGSAIVTRDGRLAGVFTWVDACRAFAEHLQAQDPHPDGGDAA